MASSRIGSIDHAPSFQRTGCAEACYERVKAAAQFAFDCLVMLWYLVEHAFNWCMSDRSAGKRVFKERFICETHNHAKLSELWDYVKIRRNPPPLPQETERVARKYGFSKTKTHISTKPHTKGACQGSVFTFFKKWFETEDILQVSELLEGGVPLEGALYQEIYATVFEDIYYEYLVEKIQEYVETYPEGILLDPAFSNASVIFNGLQAYLASGRQPKEGGMAEWVRAWAIKNKKTLIGGPFYASLRKAAKKYDGIQTYSAKDRTLAAYSLAGLKAEILHYDAPPGDVLRTIGTLPPGAYNFTFSTYGPTGCKKGRHTIAFIIQERGFSFFYDPNNSVAYGPREEVQETIGRLLEGYTGFDYSENLDGAYPSTLGKIANFLQERANPSSTPLTSGIDLFKVSNN